MRIVITVPWGQRLGGAEAMLQGVFDGAVEAGHKLEPVFFQDGPWPAELRQAGFRVEVIDAGRLREVHRWLATVRRLAGLLRARKPDLILNWAAKTQLYGAPAAMLAGMTDRVIWWQQAIPRRDWIDMSATLLPATAVGCYSRAAAQAQERLFPKRQTFVVGAGSPLPAGGPSEPPLSLPDDVPIVGLVGRLQPWKGQDRMLRAQAILRDRGHRMHLVIVGGDSYGLSPEYAASLPVLIEQLGLGADVTMTGEVPDASPYIEQMDVLVNASDPEPFGIVILEGMARGVAVMAVNSGGPGDFVQDGQTGALARSGQPDALADALEPLLTSPELRERLGRAGRERYLQEFTTAAMCRRFFAEMEGVLRGKGRTAAPSA
ncbi:MAG TPA: glycosyltransferase [Solirubrobacteraceae bacterium]|nr:glycosyltransferase [Solirubrobacteraceae bacterium]